MALIRTGGGAMSLATAHNLTGIGSIGYTGNQTVDLNDYKFIMITGVQGMSGGGSAAQANTAVVKSISDFKTSGISNSIGSVTYVNDTTITVTQSAADKVNEVVFLG